MDTAPDGCRSRAADLFTFVREFVRLSLKPVASLDSYVQTLWLDELPREAECRFAGWDQQEGDEQEAASETWLTVARPDRPDPPALAEELARWIDATQWQDSSTQCPALLPRILNPDWKEQAPEAAPQFIELAECPDVTSSWQEYVVTEWLPWAEADRRKVRVQRLYDDLFGMHRTQVAMAEQYEFLLAVGCLHWAVSSGGQVKRHLLVLPVTVDFDPVNAVVSVRSAGANPEVRVETDMLDVQDRPSEDVEARIDASRKSVGDEIFSREAKTLLRVFAQGMHSEGVFIDSLDRVAGIPSETPEVHFAPALVVRRRTSTNALSACESIVRMLRQDQAVVPAPLRRFVGELGCEKPVTGTDEVCSAPENVDGEVYFPRPSNDEQRCILDALPRQHGVLVQGPPGTGKSQTIANLVCHLLATGNRVLVTSQKAPALRVLSGMLPPAVRDLCIMVLGEGADERQELSRSVRHVASRYANWSASQAQRRIEALREELRRCREREAEAFEALCSLREKETFHHGPLFGDYAGVLGEIAARVREEVEQFAWFSDRLPAGTSLIGKSAYELPVAGETALRLLCLLRNSDPEREVRSRKHLIPPEVIPTPEQFLTLTRTEQEAALDLDRQRADLEHPARPPLSKVAMSELSAFLGEVDLFRGGLGAIQDADTGWEWKAVQQVLLGQSDSLRALLGTTGGLLQEAEGLVPGVQDLEVTGLGNRTDRAVLQDTRDLQKHLQQGGGLGFWLFRPATVKQTLYLTQEVRVDGRFCRSAPQLEKLVQWLEFRGTLRKLAEQWAPLATIGGDGLPVNQVLTRYGEAQQSLESILELGDAAAALAAILNEWAPGLPRVWHDPTQLAALRDLVSALIAAQKLAEIQTRVEAAEQRLRTACLTHDCPEEFTRLCDAIHLRNVDDYSALCKEVASLREFREAAAERDRLFALLATHLPRLAAALRDNCHDECWTDRLRALQSAWNWVCADAWLHEMTRPGAERALQSQVRMGRESASATLATLAAEMAWAHCMVSTDERRQQALMAWLNADQNVGRTGRHAEHRRQIARQCLENCREAVPAWVMPIHKVLETVAIRPCAFDVVIVDEASQCGPDALFLSFLGEKLIVVGDDEQIRPDYVGLDQASVQELQRRYLAQVPNGFLFGPPYSLFSASQVFFSSQVRLREHFRCMPEIIAFSNRLCYSDQPLIPLRQFGQGRLKPLVCTYVTGAYQEGQKVNRKEAEGIVDAIEKCCEDPAYKGKTFGVISLLHTSSQDREIERLLMKRLDAEEIERRNIVCGDAYDFQGDERDVIFLSMVSARGENSRIGTLSEDDPKARRRFNVAVSRARDQVHLFHSVQDADLSERCLRRRLLLHMRQPSLDATATLPWTLPALREFVRATPRRRGNQPPPFDSWFEVDVYLVIADQGCLAIPQYEVSGFRIDIVVMGGAFRVALECDGDEWHGPEEYAKDLRRQRQLERCGWQFCRIRASEFRRDPSTALAPVWELLTSLEEQQAAEEGKDNLPAAPPTAPLPPEAASEAATPTTPVDKGNTESVESEEEMEQKVGEPPTCENERLAAVLNHIRREHVGTDSVTVDRVLAMTNREVGHVLCEILEQCPNHTAKKDDLVVRVCQYFGIITRAGPREQLKKKIGWAVTHLKKVGKLEEYKAKNVRVRLLHPTGQQRLF